MEVDRSDLEKIHDALADAADHHVHRDISNARLHQARETRYSPLTSNLVAQRERLEQILKESR